MAKKYTLTKALELYSTLNEAVTKEAADLSCYMSKTPSYAKYKALCDLIIRSESLEPNDYKALNDFIAEQSIMDMF